MNPNSIPLPIPSDISKPHWEGCRRGELRVQRCRECGSYVFIPRFACTRCLSDRLDWAVSSGRGKIYSFTVVHRPQRPEFEVPYVVAIVELEEGWHMLSNIIDCSAQEVAVGLPVEVVFREMSETVTLPYFRLRTD